MYGVKNMLDSGRGDRGGRSEVISDGHLGRLILGQRARLWFS